MKLNMGCGYKKMEGYINIDNEKAVNPDLLLDLTKTPYPFKENSITDINARFVLEHFRKDKVLKILDEWYRISKDGAIWDLNLPFYNNRQITNLDHYSAYDFNSFDFLNPKHHRNYYSKTKAEVIYVKATPTLRGRFIPFRRFFCYSIGEIYDGINFKLRVIKK